MAEGDQAVSPVDAAERYERIVRVAVLLTGDNEMAQTCVDEAIATSPRTRREETLGDPVASGLWQALVHRVALVEERLGTAAAPVVAAVRRNVPARPTTRELRWAVLALPVLERAALVLRSSDLPVTAVADVLRTTTQEVRELTDRGRAAVSARLGLDTTDEVIGDELGGLAASLAYQVDPLHVTAALAGRRTFVDRARPRDAAAVGAAAVVLAGVLAWLAVRTPPRPAVLSAPVARNVATPSTVGGPVEPTTTSRPDPTTAVTTATTAEATTVATTAVRAAEAPPATEPEPESPDEPAAPVRVTLPTRPAATSAPATVPPTTPRAPATAPETVPAATTAPTTAPSPTTAPITASLRVATATCAVAANRVSLRFDGQVGSAASEIVLTTPWGTWKTLGRGKAGAPMSWVFAVSARTSAPPSGPQAVTVTAGSDSARVSVAC